MSSHHESTSRLTTFSELLRYGGAQPPLGEFLLRPTRQVRFRHPFASASGRYKDDGVFCARGKTCYYREYVLPSDPKTERQTTRRTSFGSTQSDWKNLTAEERDGWTAYGQRWFADSLSSSPGPNTYNKAQSCRLGWGELELSHTPPVLPPPPRPLQLKEIPAPEPHQIAFQLEHTLTAFAGYRIELRMTAATINHRKPQEPQFKRAGEEAWESFFPLAESGGVYLLERPRHTVPAGERFGLGVRLITPEGIPGPELRMDLIRLEPAPAEPVEPLTNLPTNRGLIREASLSKKPMVSSWGSAPMATLQLLLLLALLTLSRTAPAAETPVYNNPDAPVDARVDDLMSRLTMEEKAFLCHGNFTSGGVPRLGIGPLLMLDGRQGLRPVLDDRGTKTTSLPCALALSCTWDEQAAQAFGRVLGQEMLAFKRHVMLAPMLNLIRSPLGGRNFENLGEDPLLVGRMGSAYIQGVQKQGVGACSCLLVANDCEHRRHFTSSNMDERTLREMHALSYELSVRDGQVWSMMTGNNLLNGIHCAENKALVQDLMKDAIGFDGVMITDWRAAYNTIPTAIAGTDMTTGHCSYVFGDQRLLNAVKSGKVPEALFNDKVRRVLRLYVRSGVLDPERRGKGGIDTPEHRATARRLAAEGMVLLKNEKQVLPLEPGKVRRILVTGPGADRVLQGGGSGSVPAAINVPPLRGLQTAFDDKAKITHLPYRVNLNTKVERGSVEWDANTTGPKRRRARATAPVEEIPTTGALAIAAQSADAVVFVAASMIASEGRDLPDMELPGKQAEAIAALAAVHPKVVVVLMNNGAVSLDNWGLRVPAILAIHYSGQATGNALADVLTGKVNPGGKLSYTFGKYLENYACHALEEWPARLVLPKDPVNPGMKPEERKATHAFSTDYDEGVFTGYRWFDDNNIEPWFPFGHGLSYTTFEMSGLKVERADGIMTVSCTVKNTGKRAGSEVVQVYVAPPKSAVPRPVRELKGFAKVRLNPGESREVRVPLRQSALAYYDVETKKWKADAGEYELQVGNSSRDIRLRETVRLENEELCAHY